jgi:P-type E1-E2 ATPase
MVKGGKYLEAIAEADTVVFDKTGTLTVASPVVSRVIPFAGYERDEVLRTAACLEEHFPHSVARAVVRKAQEEQLHHEEEHAEVEYIVAHGIATLYRGKRVVIGSYHFVAEDEKVEITPAQKDQADQEAKGDSVVFLGINGKMAGFICVTDPPREKAAEAIAALKAAGIRQVVMLTGDGDATAKIVAERLGIDSYRSQVLPEDKAAIVKALKAEGHKVVMVGDGINDSPALAAADVSVAMKDSSDIAREVADITLLTSDLHSLVTVRKLSQKLMNRVKGNFQSIISVNTAILFLGLTGTITPNTSALLHNAFTMAISASSTRPCLKEK